MILNIAFPFILALFIAYLINPAVEGFEKVGLKRRTSIIYVYILFISILLGIFVLLLPQLYKNIRELTFAIPQIASEYNSKVNLLLDFVVKSGFPADFTNILLAETISSVKSFELYSIAKLKDMLIDSIMLLPSLLGLLLSLIIAFYFLRDIELFKKFVYSLVPSKFRNDVSIAGREINLVIKNFIQGQLLTMIAVTCLEVIGLYFAGVKFPFFLGVVGGIANIIPYFGPVLGSIPAVFIALSQSTSTAIWTVLVFVVVQQIDNTFISPRIIEGKLGIHPVSTMLIVLLGGEFFGVLGMFLAVPVCASLKIVLKRVIERVV